VSSFECSEAGILPGYGDGHIVPGRDLDCLCLVEHRIPTPKELRRCSGLGGRSSGD
jgi:hypothetical protein